MKVILIRYSEIHLKGNNRYFFENLLYSNLKHNFRGIECKLEKSSSRYVVSNFEQEFTTELHDRARSTFGVHSVSVAEVTDNNFDNISQIAISHAKKLSGTFKIVTNRADKTFPLNSMQVSQEIGGLVLDSCPSLQVDIHNPQNTIHIDIRENDKTFIFSSIEKAVNGLPVGSSGKGMVLLSGGIDSPVACYMLAKRGMSLRAVHFHSFPFTSLQAKQKVLDLARIVNKYCLNLTVDIVSFTEIQTAIHEKCPSEFMITIMRRFMMRISEQLAKQHKCGAIITGESLGQVASQTLESMASTNSVTTMPVLRPLVGFDKDEIIDIAKRIGTFETSILPHEDCCTIFLPKNPAIRPNIKTVERFEKLLDIDALIKRALSNIETVTID